MKNLSILFLVAVASIAKAQTGYKIGDLATDFKLENVDGKMVSLANYKNAKGFFVIFTCNHCPYAKAYEQRIIELDAKYAAKGYPVIAINPNDPTAYPEDSFENMKKRAKDKKYAFPYLIDETQNVTRAYGARATPHLYLLKKTDEGNRVRYIGAIDDDTENINPNKTKYAENAADALLKNGEPKISQTKAVGCSIKWKNEK